MRQLDPDVVLALSLSVITIGSFAAGWLLSAAYSSWRRHRRRRYYR